jgi:ubiquinol-cytochrome c reductase cytochrome c1 subunit
MIKHAMIKVGLTLALVLGAAAPALAEEGEGMPHANTKVSNIAAVQRGAKLYFNYCIGCHSLKYMMYSRIGEDLKLSDDQVINSLAIPGAKIGDYVRSSMPVESAKTWFGKAPPDLSLEARAKGPDWVYNYLKSFYVEPARPVGWNNTVFPGASMPNVLWELQGVQHAEMAAAKQGEEAHIEKLVLAQPGKQSAEAFDETARDITTFLQYVAEPAALKREKLGVWVVLYLALFTLLAYVLKTEYWKDVH